MTDAQSEWARCRQWIASALECEPRLFTIEDVERRIAAGELQFWPGKKCAVITEVDEYPLRTVCNVFAASGEYGLAFDEIMKEMQPKIIAWAKERGCTLLIGTGRRGWAKRVARDGYYLAWITACREI